MHRTPVRRAAILAAAVAVSAAALLAAPGAAAQEVSDPRAADAIDLYDAGDYAEAARLLEALDAEGAAGGTLLYRLSFCRRVAGDRQGELEALQRAATALEAELETAGSLEVPFYLANANMNLRRPDAAREVAALATARVESGEWPAPTSPMDMFRLAKLYQDQSLEARAVEWYRKSLDGFAASETKYPGNVAWARRYLGELAYVKTDYAAAEREYAALAESGAGNAADLDRLAVARVKQRKWAAASDAWRKSEQLDRVRGDRARYCWRLAKMAADVGTLPERAPEDKSWNQLSREDLENLMRRQAEIAQAAVASAADGADADRRRELQAEVDAAKPIFLRAALEYAARNHPIRETAFQGGFAPMIFHESRWTVPPEKKN